MWHIFTKTEQIFVGQSENANRGRGTKNATFRIYGL